MITHTSGGALDFQDQINDQNLISLDGNYTTAGVIRFNNSTAMGGTSPIGFMAKTGNNFTCYDPSTGAKQVCLQRGQLLQRRHRRDAEPDLGEQRRRRSDRFRRRSEITGSPSRRNLG